MALLVRLRQFLHRWFLAFLVASYALAMFIPGPGLALRRVSVGTLHLAGGHTQLSAPTLLLAWLLLNAALGIAFGTFVSALRRPRQWVIGLATNLVAPLLFTLACSQVLAGWSNLEELESLLVGLAVVSCMPIAGSSTAWAQKAGGNVALSLTLVLGSTLLSPLTTPMGFSLVSKVTRSIYAEDLHILAGAGTQLFLLIAVVVPAASGMLLGRLLGQHRVSCCLPVTRCINLLLLLVLNYSNAAAALPHVLASPDWRFLGLIAVAVSLRSALGFVCGYAVGRLTRAKRDETTSLTFGLGMANDGSGLVLLTAYVTDLPDAVLAIVAFNLVQQLAAGIADRMASRSSSTQPSTA